MSEFKVMSMEPTAEMVEAAEEAYMPFGDMDLAIRMALLTAPDVQGEPVVQYNRKRIGWELERTAMGDGFYGNALRVAKDFPELSDEDRSVLDRYSTGAQRHSDHIALQVIAMKVYTAQQPAEQQESVPDGWRSRFLKFMGEMQSQLDESNDDPIPSELWSLWRELLDAAPQPAEQKPLSHDWDGEGVPPIGTVCEYHWVDDDWRRCEIVGHYFGSVVAVDVVDASALRLPVDILRPIKTPEQQPEPAVQGEQNQELVPAGKPDRITEQDVRDIATSYCHWKSVGFYNTWFSEKGRELLNKLNSDREQVPTVEALVEALEEAYGTLERAVSPADETPEAAIQSAMFVIDEALAAHQQPERGRKEITGAVVIQLTPEQAEALEYALYAQDVTNIVIEAPATRFLIQIQEDDSLTGVGEFGP